MQLSPEKTVEIVTRSFYKEIDGNHIVWTCNEDTKEEDGKFIAFCVLTPVEKQGVIVDYWFHLNVSLDSVKVSLAERLEDKTDHSNNADAETETIHTEKEGGNLEASFKLPAYVSSRIERHGVLRRYLTMKLDIPSKCASVIIGRMSGHEVGRKFGSYLGNQFVR